MRWTTGPPLNLMPQVILVDQNDAATGTAEQKEVHEYGLLHRAISVFLFRISREMLLQQRVYDKYHSTGLHSNTCCSHPGMGEKTGTAAHRRLQEEMGIDCYLVWAFDMLYRAEFENGSKENEYDHVYI